MKSYAIYGYDIYGRRIKSFTKKTKEQAERINTYLKDTNTNLCIVMKEEPQYKENDSVKFRVSYQSEDVYSGKIKSDIGDNRVWITPERINGKFLAGKSRNTVCVGKNMIIV